MSAEANLDWVERLADAPPQIRDKVKHWRVLCQQMVELRREIRAEQAAVLTDIQAMYSEEEIQKAVSYAI